jgi:hypothetical protein
MRNFLILTAVVIFLQSTIVLGATSAVVVAHGVIQNAHIHVAITKKKPRLKSRVILAPINPEEEFVVDDDLVLGRNRNRLEIINEQEEEISDYVKIRLMLARMKAMEKYRKVWQS